MKPSTEKSVSSSSRPARSRRTLQSGFSLLARGEPQIWLIGGMLVVCLTMIAALLALILYSGLPTFWPRQVDWLVLNDGSQDIGQPQSRTTGPIAADHEGADAENTTAADTTTQGDADLQDAVVQDTAPQTDGSETGYSSYYRTGNYRISGEHYRWIDSPQLTDAGIATPDWAMVVERLEWGRFYGVPVLFSDVLGVPETTSRELEQIDALRDALTTAQNESDAEELSEAITALTSARNAIHRQALQTLVSAQAEELGAGERLQVQVEEDGPWLRLGAASTDYNAARKLIGGSPAAAAQLPERLKESLRLRAELDTLRYQVSRLDEAISELRVDVRRAELKTDASAAAQPDAIHYTLEQQVDTADKLSLLQGSSEWLNELVGDSAEKVNQAIRLAQATALPAAAAQLDGELAEWLELFSEQPQPIADAMKAYAQGYRRVYEKKRPLQREIERLESLASRDAFHFSIPNAASEICPLSEAEFQTLKRGEFPDALKEQFSQLGIELPQGGLDVDSLSPQLSLLDYEDVTGQQQAFAIVAKGYVDGPPTPTLYQLNIETLPCEELVRVIAVNRISTSQKIGVYLDRWREFLLDNPREANSEGGVFPAIWGTIVMTLIMTIAVVPFGVMAALYLREYAGAGPLVSVIRISINNLAGVPSIVYGVFGFSFFCYTIGAYIDGGPSNADIVPLPSPAWFMLLGITAIAGTAAFFMSFFGSASAGSNPSTARKWIGRFSMLTWLACLGLGSVLILKSPFFDGFYQAYLPNPTFGKGGLLWASLTLALLTLPVVIVATEEALSAVPNSLREGSLACGASKWQTIRRIILPHARPGILTGAILAMARGAGEVAPLMLVGALPSAPDLPVDTEFPFVHLSRSFMHLGYQIYVLGFQSQNSDAAIPMVFTCTLLLIAIVASLNIFAIMLRARLKKRFQGNQF